MKTAKTATIRYYLMMEMVFALGLLMLLTVAFSASLNTIRRMDKSFTDENCGLMVVDNTIERLAHLKRYKVDDVQKIFLEEYRESGIVNKSKTLAVFTPDVDGAKLAIVKDNGQPLIEVKIKCQQ